MIYKFRGYSLDVERRELRRDSLALEVQPKVLDLILYLIEARDRVVSRNELLDALWGDAAVIEGVLSTAVHAARGVLEDSASKPRFIKTVARRGYRFVAEVEAGAEARPGPLPQSDADPWTTDLFVGRGGCLARLNGAFTAATAGRGRVLVITGEAGIGKTRLLDELAQQAHGWGARVLAARCYEGEASPPYWPWVQVLREAILAGEPADVLIDMGAGASDLAVLVPALHELRPDLPEPPRLQSGPARFRLFESIAAFPSKLSKRAPIVILIDDVQSADHASQRLLGFLARSVRYASVLIVVAVRDREGAVDPMTEETLAELAHHSPGERMRLQGLSESETGELIESLSGFTPSPALAQAVARRSEGNPFFVREIVNLLKTQGQLDNALDPADWTGDVPPGVRDVILRRVHRRTQSCQDILALAAVLGRAFRRDLLAGLADLDGDAFAAGLREAVDSGFLSEHPTAEGVYQFAHGLMQETLYAEWSAADRAVWHRRAGEALEAVPDSVDTPAAELAHHFLNAVSNGGGAEKYVDYAVLAAEHAIDMHAHDEAVKHYGRALEALELFGVPDDAQRCELLIALGTAQLNARRSDPSGRDSLLRAAEMARTLQRPDKLARAALELAAISRQTGPGDPVVIDLLETARSELDPEDLALRARVMAALAIQRLCPESHEQAASLSDEAVRLARKAADPVTLGETLNLQCTILSGPEHVRDRLRHADALLELAAENDNPELAFFGHRWRMLSLLELGEVDAVDQEFRAYCRSAGEARWASQWYSLTSGALRAFIEGRLDRAERFTLDALAGRRHELTPLTVYTFGAQLMWLRRAQGRLGEVQNEYARRVDYIDSRFPVQAAFRVTRALLDAERGSPETARDELARVVADRLSDLPHDFTYLYCLSVLSELSSAVGDSESAAVLHEALLPYAAHNVILFMGTVCLGSASRYLGQLATTLCDWRGAEEHFEAALTRNQQIRARLWTAHTELDYARMLYAKGGANAAAQTDQRLERCIGATQELGLRGLRSQALAFQAEL